MRQYFRIPLFFLMIGALIGTLLRWHFVTPFAFLRFNYWLHAHSHMMFIGWISNFIILALVYKWLPEKWRPRYRALFLIIQVLIVGLLISFLLQGYGPVSIALLSAFTLCVYIFIVLFYRDTWHNNEFSLKFIRAALIFFVISSLGAFALGPIAANGLGQSEWYFFAIFFYLHFQYNGFFLFAMLGLLFKIMEEKQMDFSITKAEVFRKFLFFACFPAYFLSTLWSDPGLFILLIAIVSAAMQLVAFVFLLRIFAPIRYVIVKEFSLSSRILLTTSALSFTIKIALQAISAVPAIANLASEVRFFVLAYLHLVLIGLISFFILFWLLQSGFLRKLSRGLIIILVSSFILSEVVMAMTPLLGSKFQLLTMILLLLSVLMTICFTLPQFLFKRDAQ